MIWARRIVLLAIVLLTLPRAVVFGAGFWGMSFPPEVPVVAYLTRDAIVPDQVIKTPGDTIRAMYDQFAGRPSFAAFAADATGHWGWAGGKHSTKAAREQALARCGEGSVVMFETRPEFYNAERLGQTVSQDAALGMMQVTVQQPGIAPSYALAEDGSWAVQTLADGAFLPQWAVLNRCRAQLEPRRENWPRALPWPQCRIFRGAVSFVLPDGTLEPFQS